MNKERLDYLLNFAEVLKRFQDSDMTFHKEINDLVNSIRHELGLKEPENVLHEFHIDKFSELNVSIDSQYPNGNSQGSIEKYRGPLHVVILKK